MSTHVPSQNQQIDDLIDLFEEYTPLFSILRERRGWSDDYLAQINNPSYDRLKDMDLMIEALHRVRTSGEQIVVMPDFDMDGITSGVLGWAGLGELGFNVELYVPDYRRGHDVTVAAIDELHAQFPQATTVITCDSGVNSHAGIQRGQQLGLTMLVTDHHVELPPGSSADITVNPERMDETYAHPGICGAFVLYQVLHAYTQRYVPQQLSDIQMLKLFAGIGTVSDVMPLFYENREMVRNSLSIARMLYMPIPYEDTATEYDIDKSLLMMLLRIHGGHNWRFLSAFEGFAITLQAFREVGKMRQSTDLDEQFYAFYLAPAFNSIRRMDGDMHDAFGTFTSPTPEGKLDAIRTVIQGNERRKELTIEYMEQLETTDQPYAPWAYLTDAPAGMLGLLASNIMQSTGMPAIVITREDDPSAYRGGSARSPFWFPVISTMAEGGFTAVGHENACGVRMRDEDELSRFVTHMADRAQQLHADAMADGTLAEANRPDLVLGAGPDADGTLDNLEELLGLIEAIERIKPFGHGFPPPAVDLVVDLAQTSIGTLGTEDQHLKIVLRSGLKLLWWNEAERLNHLAELADSPIPGESIVRLRAKLLINEFRGNRSAQAFISGLIETTDGTEQEEM